MRALHNGIMIMHRIHEQSQGGITLSFLMHAIQSTGVIDCVLVQSPAWAAASPHVPRERGRVELRGGDRAI